MAIYANLSIDQGTDFASAVSVTDSTGRVFDLTGYVATGQIRKSYSSLHAISFTCAIPSPTTGVIQLTLSSAVTGSMRAGRYLYDIDITLTSNGAVTRVVQGQVEINPGVTRPAVQGIQGCQGLQGVQGISMGLDQDSDDE